MGKRPRHSSAGWYRRAEETIKAEVGGECATNSFLGARARGGDTPAHGNARRPSPRHPHLRSVARHRPEHRGRAGRRGATDRGHRDCRGRRGRRRRGRGQRRGPDHRRADADARAARADPQVVRHRDLGGDDRDRLPRLDPVLQPLRLLRGAGRQSVRAGRRGLRAGPMLGHPGAPLDQLDPDDRSLFGDLRALLPHAGPDEPLRGRRRLRQEPPAPQAPALGAPGGDGGADGPRSDHRQRQPPRHGPDQRLRHAPGAEHRPHGHRHGHLGHPDLGRRADGFLTLPPILLAKGLGAALNSCSGPREALVR